MTDYDSLVPEHWHERLGWNSLPAELREAIGEFGFYMYRLGTPTMGDIDQVKYDGRLVVLDDGSRWEVNSADTYTADMWSPVTKVIVIDDVMYNLDDAEHVDVTEDS
jgi:hypothetical protein